MQVEAGMMTTVAGNQVMGFGSSGDGGPATSALLWWPTVVAATPSGDIFIGDTGNYVIRKVTQCALMRKFRLSASDN